MSNTPGSLRVPVRPVVDPGFGTALETQLAGPLSRVGSKVAAVGKMIAVGLGVGLAAGAAGLVLVGKSFDEAYDKIRVGTGATGAALEDLKADFRDVVSSVPASFGDASQAIADLNTRLGITGEPLRNLSKQVLEMSRITGSDLSTNIETVSRVFGDWGVETDQQSNKLDALFRASQATGPSVDRLAQLMTKFGSPLRQLGFDFDTTAALLGKFEKEGVNTELVMGSMRIALGKFARDGEPAEETLARLTEQIKNAGSSSEANAIALETFGARAGPDMAAAIREGRFELGDLLDTVSNGSETILSAAKDTESFGEKWTKLKNRVLVALEPVAIRVFDAIGNAMDLIAPHVEGAISGVTKFGTSFVRFVAPIVVTWGPRIVAAVQDIAKTIGSTLGKSIDFIRRNAKAFEVLGAVVGGAVAAFTALLVLDKLVRIFQAVRAAVIAVNLALAANPIILVFLAIGALIGALVLAYKRFEGFRNVVDTVARTIRDAVVKSFQWFAENVLPVLIWYVSALWEGLKAIGRWISTDGVAAWNRLRSAVMSFVDWIRTNVGPVIEALGELFSAVFSFISTTISVQVKVWQAVIGAAWAVIRPVLSWVWEFLQPQLKAALEIISAVWSGIWTAISGVARAVWGTIRGTIESGLQFIRGIIQIVTGIISGDWRKAWEGIKNVLGGILGSIRAIVSGAFNGLRSVVWGALVAVSGIVSGVWNGIVNTIAGVGGRIAGAARGMWDGISGAFRGVLNWIIDRWNGLEFKLPSVDFMGQHIGGFTLGVPDIPRLASGGTATSPGLSIVGDGGNGSGAELLALRQGASVVPLDVAAMIAGAALAGRDSQDGAFRDLVVVEPAATAEEIADTVDRRIAWRASLPGTGVQP